MFYSEKKQQLRPLQSFIPDIMRVKAPNLVLVLLLIKVACLIMVIKVECITHCGSFTRLFKATNMMRTAGSGNSLRRTHTVTPDQYCF